MADQLDVSPATIMAESEKFSGIADTARRIRRDLTDRLSGLRPIAGDDSYGKEFDVQFHPAVDSAGTVLDGVGGGMEQAEANLRVTASLYTKSDNVNTDLGLRLR